MIILRCTAKAAKALHFHLLDDAPAGTSPLGDWYVNLIPTAVGGMFLFMNEQSLLAVVVPVGTPALLHTFVARVGNLLSMIGLPNERIEREIDHFKEARAAKTVSKRVLGVMNDFAYHVQIAFDRATPRANVSFSDLELHLASIPQATLGFRRASEMALELMKSGAQHGAV
jgi:hypothetical protein